MNTKLIISILIPIGVFLFLYALNELRKWLTEHRGNEGRDTIIRISYDGEEFAVQSRNEENGVLTVTGDIVGELGEGYDEEITFHIPAQGEDLRLLRDPIFTWLLVNEETGKAWINDMPWEQNEVTVPVPLKR